MTKQDKLWLKYTDQIDAENKRGVEKLEKLSKKLEQILDDYQLRADVWNNLPFYKRVYTTRPLLTDTKSPEIPIIINKRYNYEDFLTLVAKGELK